MECAAKSAKARRGARRRAKKAEPAGSLTPVELSEARGSAREKARGAARGRTREEGRGNETISEQASLGP